MLGPLQAFLIDELARFCRLVAVTIIFAIAPLCVSADIGKVCGSGRSLLDFYCVVNKASEGEVSLFEARHLRLLLEQYGYTAGNSLPPVQIHPMLGLSYEQNMNGGNPHKDLTVGGLRLASDPTFYSVEDAAMTLGLQAEFHHIFREGWTIDAAASAVGKQGLSTGIQRSQFYGNACLDGHISNWTYLHTCITGSSKKAQLSSSTEQSATIGLTKYRSTSLGSSSISASMRFDLEDSSQPGELGFGFEQLLPSGTKIEAEAWQQTRVSARSNVSIGLNGTLSESASWSIQASRQEAGRFLGVARTDDRLTASLSFTGWQNTSVMIGFQHTDSSIDYFDSTIPFASFSLNF